jgi:splicing factor 45
MEDFGTRIMKKYGWKDGQGLGKESQGISAPLLAKKTSGHAGVIINPDIMGTRTQSRVVILEVVLQCTL